jgi:hypothetical protein
MPPLDTTALLVIPPALTISAPPLLMLVLNALPAETSSEPPLRMVVLLAVPAPPLYPTNCRPPFEIVVLIAVPPRMPLPMY